MASIIDDQLPDGGGFFIVNDIGTPPMPSVQWAEYITRAGSIEEKQYSYENGNQITGVYLVNWADAELARKDLLGINFYDRANQVISRQIPACHPIQNWMFAASVHTKGLKFLGKIPYTPFMGATSFVSSYQYMILTVVYKQPRYRVISDTKLDDEFKPVNFGGVRQEQQRFVENVPQLATETLSREGGTFQWAETGLGVGAPTVGTAFTSPVPQALAKGDVVYLWRKVPLYQALIASLGDNAGRPENLDSVIGTINQYPLFGYPAQTLRFNGYRIMPIECPFSPLDMGLRFLANIPSLVADVELNWSYWNPPPGTGPLPVGTAPTTRGHNLAPNPGDNLWYRVSVPPGGSGSAGIYVVADHNIVWQLPG